jgi:hypothetical protein
MRCKASVSRSGDTTEDIRKDLTLEQLAGIGKVAMAWNELEFLLDIIVGTTIVVFLVPGSNGGFKTMSRGERP